MAKEVTDPKLAELEMIRKLLVLALLRSGITQAQLGGVLGMSQSQVSKMFPAGAFSALNGKGKKGPGKSVPAAQEIADG